MRWSGGIGHAERHVNGLVRSTQYPVHNAEYSVRGSQYAEHEPAPIVFFHQRVYDGNKKTQEQIAFRSIGVKQQQLVPDLAGRIGQHWAPLQEPVVGSEEDRRHSEPKVQAESQTLEARY